MQRIAPGKLSFNVDNYNCAYEEHTLGHATFVIAQNGNAVGTVTCTTPSHAQATAITPKDGQCVNGKDSRTLVMVCPW